MLRQQDDNKIMSNRYDKINALMHYHDQKNHYYHILNPRNTFHRIDQRHKYQSLYIDNKMIHETLRNRKIQDKKRQKALKSINNKKGIFAKMEQEQQNDLKGKRKSLVNQFKIKQMNKGRQRQNKMLGQKLLATSSKIGNLSSWQRHSETYKNYKQKLNKFAINQMYDPTPDLIKTFTQFNQKKINLQTNVNRKRKKNKKRKLKRIKSNQQNNKDNLQSNDKQESQQKQNKEQVSNNFKMNEILDLK